MNKVSIYGEPGCQNHGNEAIVRGVCKIFSNSKIRVFSADVDSGIRFSLNKICHLEKQGIAYHKYMNLYNVLRKLKIEIFAYYSLFYRLLSDINGVYMLEAGDQYCEGDSVRRFYSFANRMIRLFGGHTIMMGCTIDKKIFSDKHVLKDLKRYTYIIPRESITYSNLLEAGIKDNVELVPCPAFVMEAQECPLPSVFRFDVVGINVGFLSQGNERYYNTLVQNYTALIEYIIEETNYNIAFIPHVNWGGKNSDIATMYPLYKKYKDSGRVTMIKDQNAMRLKFIISKCRFMVALRTHASVSALSSSVPTILTGYKTKTKGIVRDIMNGDENLMLELQSISSVRDLTSKFQWMEENEDKIRMILEENMPYYIDKCYRLKDIVNTIN